MLNTIMNYMYANSYVIELFLGVALIFVSLCEAAQNEIDELVEFYEEDHWSSSFSFIFHGI